MQKLRTQKQDLLDTTIDAIGVENAKKIYNGMISSIVIFFLAFLVVIITLEAVKNDEPVGSIASGVNETSVETLQLEVKKEELKEQILSRQAVLVNKNKAITDGIGLLAGKELKLAELEIAKNKLEKEELDNCLDAINQGEVDFNCLEQANKKARK